MKNLIEPVIQRMITRTKPGIQEMELWPDLLWRLSALLHAGGSVKKVFGRIEQKHISATHARPTSRPAVIRRRERKTLELAQQDIDSMLASARGHAELGLPISAALNQLVESRGFLRDYSLTKVAELSACWSISERTGAPIAQLLERLARFYENDIDLWQARESAMSAPKATGRILSRLPLLGFGLGIVMGTDPLGVLFNSVPGVLAAITGVVLAFTGSRWTARLVTRAESGDTHRKQGQWMY